MEQTECSVHRMTVVARAAPCGMGHGGDRCPDECPEVGANNHRCEECPEVRAYDDRGKESPEVGANGVDREANCCEVGAYVDDD